jgi:hypothetical protein
VTSFRKNYFPEHPSLPLAGWGLGSVPVMFAEDGIVTTGSATTVGVGVVYHALI